MIVFFTLGHATYKLLKIFLTTLVIYITQSMTFSNNYHEKSLFDFVLAEPHRAWSSSGEPWVTILINNYPEKIKL